MDSGLEVEGAAVVDTGEDEEREESLVLEEAPGSVIEDEDAGVETGVEDAGDVLAADPADVDGAVDDVAETADDDDGGEDAMVVVDKQQRGNKRRSFGNKGCVWANRRSVARILHPRLKACA